MSRYEQNRAKIPLDQLQRYADQWVAFSGDGCCIVAAAPTLSALEQILRRDGKDPQTLAFEYLTFDDIRAGAAELL